MNKAQLLTIISIYTITRMGEYGKHYQEQFKTATKTTEPLLQPSPASSFSDKVKTTIRPVLLSNIKKLCLQEHHIKEYNEAIYEVLARIKDVKVTQTDYILELIDQSCLISTGNILLPRRLFSSRKSDNNFHQLQFQESTSKGHPYFRILLKKVQKVGHAYLNVLRIDPVSDYNQLTYHRLKIMELDYFQRYR